MEEAAWEWKLELTNRTGERLSRCDRFVEAEAEREWLEGVPSAATTPLGGRRWLCAVEGGSKGGNSNSPTLSSSLSSSEEIVMALGFGVSFTADAIDS